MSELERPTWNEHPAAAPTPARSIRPASDRREPRGCDRAMTPPAEKDFRAARL